MRDRLTGIQQYTPQASKEAGSERHMTGRRELELVVVNYEYSSSHIDHGFLPSLLASLSLITRTADCSLVTKDGFVRLRYVRYEGTRSLISCLRMSETKIQNTIMYFGSICPMKKEENKASWLQ